MVRGEGGGRGTAPTHYMGSYVVNVHVVATASRVVINIINY